MVQVAVMLETSVSVDLNVIPDNNDGNNPRKTILRTGVFLLFKKINCPSLLNQSLVGAT
jgi:hypothetical protein